MKFLKPTFVIIIILALTYTVSASKSSFNALTSTKNTVTDLPLNGDLLFAFAAIATLGGYLAFKK